MRNALRYIVLVGLLSGFVRCQKASDNGGENTSVLSMAPEHPKTFERPEQLVAFVNDEENGYIRKKTLHDISYYGVLKPTDFLLAQRRIEAKTDTLQKEDFEDLQYFDLRIHVDTYNQEFIKYNLESAEQYQQRIHYCAFGMQDDIQLIDGKDTLPCVLYHFERAFNVVPYGHFLLGFEKSKSKLLQTKTLVFNDRLFNNGIIQFSFSPKLLVHEPILL